MTELKKSSDEIITELFHSINTVNSSDSDTHSDENVPIKNGKKEKKSKHKKKKSKKSKHEDDSKNRKHKKKRKKRKKHKRKNTSESENEVSKKKKLKKKSSKNVNVETREDICVDNKELTDPSNSCIDKSETVPVFHETSAINSNSETSLIPLPPSKETNLKINVKKSSELCVSNNKLGATCVNSLKVADVFVEDLIETGDSKIMKTLLTPLEKPKMAIKISDLRNSTVLELAEEQAKLQHELHEDGEIIESSESSSDVSLFRNHWQGPESMISLGSFDNTKVKETSERGNLKSSHVENKFPQFSLEEPLSREIDLSKEKRNKEKHYEKYRRKSKEREKSKENSPQNSKFKAHSLDVSSLSDSKEKRKIDSEKLRDIRSKDRKRDRSRSGDKRSRSRSRSIGRFRSRSKERKKSRSKERKRSKSKDKTKSKDNEKYKDKKLCKDLGEISSKEDQLKGKYFESNKKIEEDCKHNRRSKSKERKKERSRSKESYKKKKDRKISERRGRSRDRHSKRSRSSRSRSRSKHKSEYFIDKSKLLEIARKNALNMLKQGQVNVNSTLTGAVGVGASADVNKVAAITAGGKTVDELTDFCKLLSQKEATGQESVSSDSSSDNENERPFHHPFQLKERPNNIIMNIRNCASLPVKTHQEKTTENAQQLRLQFPVSSGQQHRKTESEWIPVSSTKNEPKAILPPVSTPKYESFEPPPLPLETEHERIVQQQLPSLAAPPPPPPVFMEASVHHSNNYEIGNMISERLSEIRHQYETSNQPYQQLNCWPGMENQAGLFTGSTGARVLSAAELASGQQAWAKKDQLMCAQPVCGGMGMSLLQKMGWKPGEGLGKRSEGSLEPLKLPVKMDKRGLVCAEELPRRNRLFPPPPPKDIPLPVKSLEGKHPVSLLVEYCSRRHLAPPIFTVISEDGPAHKKNFVFKVTVNGTDFQPPTPSPNKKQAKSEAATLCLKSLNILPTV